ncbi:MAG: FAD-binding molybdopterin dehydrogenase [Gemmatales bacterium]|nr:MAG: FAD-binding molybdopterin dehydrogenase [Gemmatales bacterium]
MKNFTYYRPTTVEQAVALLDNKWGPVELLAGGTDLHDLQKEYIAQPDKVVSLNGIRGLSGIKASGSAITIGANTKLADIAENSAVRKHLPGLAEAASQVGGPQIRNMGTLGGNLCQRNRCWYFRDEHVPCLLRGGEKCLAINGENRYHACFTDSYACVMVHPSTLAPVLIALAAKATVQGPKGKREIELSRFFQAPAKADEREHVLAANEIVLSVSIPIGSKNASYEVRHKQSYDWPLVQAAAAFDLKGGKASNVRIVLGHVAPVPLLAGDAAKALEGQPVNEETAAEAGKAAIKGAKPLSQTGYKLQLVQVAVKRAILTAAGAKKYWQV